LTVRVDAELERRAAIASLFVLAAEHAADAAENIAGLVCDAADCAACATDQAVQLSGYGLWQARLEKAEDCLDGAMRLLFADACALYDLFD
jgi:hypothetical protein